ncbi:DUF2516 family protein [Streptomyces roseicoloratus]|uniref:DUF2516 family protein n=1 Tax=Streptomyces roseicoloratus TaxID=2508722 RepID=A0ABY9S7B9_9ACTN|nr:DUF2516 family protein [Streptomyces roseicoloratus]WMX48885.1 DUF2516 family protein [Streptomyces roseicoloratus]
MLANGFDSILSLVTFLVFTGFAVAAFVFAATAREDAYRAAEKQTKKFWLILLGVNLVLNLLLPMLFLQIAGLIAAIVFMVDVRPALRQVSGGGRRGGSSSDGPYGPYNGGR